MSLKSARSVTVRSIAIRYPYACKNDHDWEVYKPMSDIDLVEKCETCDEVGVRYIAKSQYFYGAGDWNQKEYNPAFGKALTPLEARKEAKRHGMIEVGNECPDKTADTFERDREKKFEARYDKIADTSIEVRSKT